MGRSAKAAKQQKATRSSAKRNASVAELTGSVSSMSVGSVDAALNDQISTEKMLEQHIARTCTGVLASIPTARDVKIEQFSLQFHGQKLIENTSIEVSNVI
jgi:ATP-binding cassette subfamily F protein 2